MRPRGTTIKPLTKSEMNERAYQRRKERERLKELHRLSGIQTYLTRQSDANKTPDCLKGKQIGRGRPKLESVYQHIPQNIYIPIREYIDTPEDRAEVAQILAKKTN